jgi:hypothetical protein
MYFWALLGSSLNSKAESRLNDIIMPLWIAKKLNTSVRLDYFEMNTVDMKYPTVSEANNENNASDLTANTSLSRNQTLGNLLAALVIKQNPREHKKVPRSVK